MFLGLTLYVLHVYPTYAEWISHLYQLDESISNFKVVGW